MFSLGSQQTVELGLSTCYDPIASEKYFGQRPWLVWTRLVEVVSSGVGFVAWSGLTAVSHSWAERGKALRNLFTSLGPTFVKLGQTLATRPDLVGEDVSEELTKLQTSSPPFDDETAKRVLEAELGMAIDEVFSHLDGRPVAAASLGQVYFGVIAEDGTQVAVKVQRPNLLESITLDIYILRFLLSVVRSAAGINTDLRLLVDEVAEGLCGELDYRREAAQAREFSAAHRHLGFVTTPEVVHRLTTKRVLTTKWVHGFSPTELLRVANSNSTSADDLQAAAMAKRAVLNLVDMGIECSLCQLLDTGVMHADPHPGNIMLSAGDGSLVYLDFGLLAYVPPKTSEAMMSLLVHLVLRDWRSFATDLDAMDLLKPTTDREALAYDLGEEFSNTMSASRASFDF
ncbi:unnamed protein product [Ostreobium quekettii]|uniref:Protein kinase domain-containing protein n=1 Tax=Ostreobium quekettii TaxID=121088 RepID=A0A8S1IU08_9CHLO|nr:unnamed protein product [Ostreobium quekettii]